MPQVELTLRRCRSLVNDVAAWYLPGDEPATWLLEIARWPVDQAAIKIVVIRQEDDLRIAGALAIPPTATFHVGGQRVPFRRLRENVYLPVDAELFPNISEVETAELFSAEYLYVWVPSRGLTAAELDQVLTLSDLIALPPPSQTNWDRAMPGIAFSQRLVAILPEQTISADEVLEEGRDDIGDRADEISKLPKAPQEPWSGIAGTAGRAAMVGMALPLLGLARLASTLGNMLPQADIGRDQSTGAGRGGGRQFSGAPGLGALDAFANQLLNRVSKALEDMRHKEITRLLHLLESDPDQGLKFAIPFGGGEHRGLSAPGGHLGMRNTNFSLSRLGGGGAADVWDMSWEYQQKLIAKYRELAALETRVGRHRRAAYIYAELLGDMTSAASILEQGGHFREAAVLYRDRLNNGQAAAECLERGELWNEAIEAYRKLGKHEKVGDLWTHIQQHAAATEAYQTAADELLEQSDLLGAARIYDEKLRDVNHAIDTLDRGWPNAPQAKQCVRASFAMRGRLGYHKSARARANELHADAEQLTRHADVTELLADVFEQYPEINVCNAAAELSRQIIANRMRSAERAEVDRLVRTLARLSPKDRLLQRDGRRFLDQRFAKRASCANQQRIGSSRSSKQLQLIHQFELGLEGVWSAATTVNEIVFVAGVMDRRIVMARCDAEGQREKHLNPWPKISVASDCPLLLRAQRSLIHTFAIGETPLPIAKVFATSERFPDAVSAGTPNGLGVVLGAARGASGQTWTIENRDDPALICVGLTGTVVSSYSLHYTSDAPWDFATTPLPMHVTKDRILLGFGSALLSVKNGRVETLERFPSRITSISGGQSYSSRLATISLEVGAVLVGYGDARHVRPFATDMQSPLTLLNQGNFAIAADDNQIEVYKCGNRKSARVHLSLCSETLHKAGQPIALLPTPHTDCFIVISSSGTVSVYLI